MVFASFRAIVLTSVAVQFSGSVESMRMLRSCDDATGLISGAVLSSLALAISSIIKQQSILRLGAIKRWLPLYLTASCSSTLASKL